MNLDKDELLKKYWLSPHREYSLFKASPKDLEWKYFNVWVDTIANFWIEEMILEHNLSDQLEIVEIFTEAVKERVQMWKINLD